MVHMRVKFSVRPVTSFHPCWFRTFLKFTNLGILGGEKNEGKGSQLNLVFLGWNTFGFLVPLNRPMQVRLSKVKLYTVHLMLVGKQSTLHTGIKLVKLLSLMPALNRTKLAYGNIFFFLLTEHMVDPWCYR